MNELIKIGSNLIGGREVPTVNARKLHEFLEVGKDFSNWIKDRIDQYGFVENQDYVCSPISASKHRGGHNRRDYHLSFDMAKELAMVERNDKGKQARQYFIACENRLKEIYAAQIGPQLPQQVEAMKILPIAVRAARSIGLNKNAAAISANYAVKQMTGTNVMKLLGHTHLEAEQQELVFTPTDLGKRIGVSGQKFNMLLAKAGLQVKEGKTWIPAPEAKDYYRVEDTTKRHNDGSMVQQVKWFDKVLSLIESSEGARA